MSFSVTSSKLDLTVANSSHVAVVIINIPDIFVAAVSTAFRANILIVDVVNSRQFYAWCSRCIMLLSYFGIRVGVAVVIAVLADVVISLIFAHVTNSEDNFSHSTNVVMHFCLRRASIFLLYDYVDTSRTTFTCSSFAGNKI